MSPIYDLTTQETESGDLWNWSSPELYSDTCLELGMHIVTTEISNLKVKSIFLEEKEKKYSQGPERWEHTLSSSKVFYLMRIFMQMFCGRKKIVWVTEWKPMCLKYNEGRPTSWEYSWPCVFRPRATVSWIWLADCGALSILISSFWYREDGWTQDVIIKARSRGHTSISNQGLQVMFPFPDTG